MRKLNPRIHYYTYEELLITNSYTMIKGYIYRLTCPIGKMYYGQTDVSVDHRCHVHMLYSQDDKYVHIAIYEAIRKYGWENFKKETVLECELHELDFYETKYIKDDNTLVPNGYNMKPGGRRKVDNLNPEDLPPRPPNARKHITYNLPPGVAEVCRPHRNEHGFLVYLEGGVNRGFISQHETMEEKYQAAMDCYNQLKAGQAYQKRANHHKWDKAFYNNLGINVPEGIKYRKDKDGFEVHAKINGVVYRKTFTKKKFTREQNLQFAIDYLNTLRQ